MASSSAPSGSKRPSDPSAQGLSIKFMINIPVKVDLDSMAQSQKTCAYLLDKLSEDFAEEDMKYMKENVAVIFGMNGKHSPQLAQGLNTLRNFSYKPVHIKHSVITYTWGEGGEIAQNATTPPYQDIREHLKNHSATVELVNWLRGGDQNCLVYFSFIDSDTFKFNSIYSEYLQIVREELSKDFIPPTVMSTGYEFTHDSDHFIASWLDREIRVAVAEVEPLSVYYPEPNFCVLVEKGRNTIKESFAKPRKKDGKMESAVLIAQVKKRADFKAVFPQKKPIIIITPERFQLSNQGLVTGQSHLSGMNLATSAYCNRAFTNEETTKTMKRGIFGKFRGFVIKLYNCQDDKKFEEMSKEHPFNLEENRATKLVEAIREAREYRKFIFKFNETLPDDDFYM